MNCERLQTFRQEIHRLLSRAKDATFELMDAVMTTRQASVPGQGYSTIAWLPEGKNSWALPLRHERITSWESPISKAAWQLKQLLKHYHHKALVLLDREYGNAKWVNATVKLKVDCVMRIRSNTCLWGTPPAYSGRGRPRKHGQKWQLTATEHWNSPDELLELVTSSYGRVRVSLWKDLHFYSAADNPVNLILVERLDPTGSGRVMPPLWLAWTGERTMPLEEIWHQYLRRFGIEHWYRFAHRNDCIGRCLASRLLSNANAGAI